MGKKVLRKGEAPLQKHTQLYDKVTKIETEVLSRIQKLKAMSKTTICHHFGVSQDKEEVFNDQVNYYDLFWKQFMLNDLGIRHASQLKKQVSEMQRKLRKIEDLFEKREEELKPFQTRKSKSNQETLQNHCQKCQKHFRDEEGLLLHRRIKHQEASEEKNSIEQDRMEIFEEDSPY